MLFISLGGMVTSLALLGIAFYQGSKNDGKMEGFIGWIAVFALLVYRMTFSIGMGPIPLLIASEIYPANIKGRRIDHRFIELMKYLLNILIKTLKKYNPY